MSRDHHNFLQPNFYWPTNYVYQVSSQMDIGNIIFSRGCTPPPQLLLFFTPFLSWVKAKNRENLPKSVCGQHFLTQKYLNPYFIFYCAHFLKNSAEIDQNWQSWILRPRLREICTKMCVINIFSPKISGYLLHFILCTIRENFSQNEPKLVKLNIKAKIKGNWPKNEWGGPMSKVVYPQRGVTMKNY